ncbi:MAG: transposase [Candidatus Gastranaerophilales bacterium]|nr:transposase [Candidatus Gastranaerophilales bacterium]
MAKKKPEFIEDEFYHIYNRGVEKRNIFLDKQDHLRFIHCLYEFNNNSPVQNLGRDIEHNRSMSEVQPRSFVKNRKRMVDVIIFTLMPNHFHLVLKQRQENGIVKFMQKLGTGYTMYFNQKYERVGGLFQGRFKAVHIKKEAHFGWLPFYIHTNPIKKSKGLPSEKIEQLNHYRWSSYLDYIGIKNFPSVTSREWMSGYLGGEAKYKKEMEDWIRDNKNDGDIDLIMEQNDE